MTTEDGSVGLDHFRDAVSSQIIASLAPSRSSGARASGKGRKPKANTASSAVPSSMNDAADLADFVDYLAEDMFACLPEQLQSISYTAVQNDAEVSERYSLPLDSVVLQELVESLPPSSMDSLSSYGLVSADGTDLDRFVESIMTTYISSMIAAPPEYTPLDAASRPDGCEICQREHVPLTYHHLIPRQMHEKAVKRGWHREWEVNKVAWLCRACHTFVHRIATNEELARDYSSVELLLERDDVTKWAIWCSKVRWKSK